jgi:Na+-driven multidrug efflux pump
MGVTGAAVATTIGRGIGVLTQVLSNRARVEPGIRAFPRHDSPRTGDDDISLVRLSGTASFQVPDWLCSTGFF